MMLAEKCGNDFVVCSKVFGNTSAQVSRLKKRKSWLGGLELSYH